MHNRNRIPHEEADLIAGLEEAACRSIADQLHLLHRYKQTIGAYDRGAAQIGDTLFELTRLGLEVHEAIAETNFRLYEELIDSLDRRKGRRSRERAEVMRRFSLRGTRGARLTISFYVDNPTSRRMSLEVKATGFHDKRNSQKTSAPTVVAGSEGWCHVMPGSLRLEADESREIQVSIDTSLIPVGQYEGSVTVLASRPGYGESEMVIELQVDEEPARGASHGG